LVNVLQNFEKKRKFQFRLNVRLQSYQSYQPTGLSSSAYGSHSGFSRPVFSSAPTSFVSSPSNSHVSSSSDFDQPSSVSSYVSSSTYLNSFDHFPSDNYEFYNALSGSLDYPSSSSSSSSGIGSSSNVLSSPEKVQVYQGTSLVEEFTDFPTSTISSSFVTTATTTSESLLFGGKKKLNSYRNFITNSYRNFITNSYRNFITKSYRNFITKSYRKFTTVFSKLNFKLLTKLHYKLLSKLNYTLL
jgi:hypothetical protein